MHAKQSLGAISVTHTKQFSEHTDSFEYQSREAVIHSLKHVSVFKYNAKPATGGGGCGAAVTASRVFRSSVVLIC